nr:immunoglobulin light chain junction region [Macaca mulatta]MOW66749.1 immunoglobulin light chain junction region [Macaca mulatta]MOW67481.1 immunoglobulin light chain junction region [Macaca mulatta]MOW69282.1 immunoglobulin light chain junction region [Macaca mulatta]MOW70440.1 immunoglobulin light chain junction region [Macaca mulatta]
DYYCYSYTTSNTYIF